MLEIRAGVVPVLVCCRMRGGLNDGRQCDVRFMNAGVCVCLCVWCVCVFVCLVCVCVCFRPGVCVGVCVECVVLRPPPAGKQPWSA